MAFRQLQTLGAARVAAAVALGMHLLSHALLLDSLEALFAGDPDGASGQRLRAWLVLGAAVGSAAAQLGALAAPAWVVLGSLPPLFCAPAEVRPARFEPAIS